MANRRADRRAIAALTALLAAGAAAPRAGQAEPLELRAATASSHAERTATPRLTRASFADPPNSVRPGTRWWWGDLADSYDFSLHDALDEVDAFHRAGFGRFEIAWGGDYGTPTQRSALQAVSERAAKYDMQVDMTLGANWPWATPDTTGGLGQQELMYGRTDVTGPSTFDSDVPTATGDDQQTGTLVAATAARVIRSGPPVLQVDHPPATSTVLDPGSLVDLTTKVVDGHLRWNVPDGNWIVFGFWMKARPESNVSLIDDSSVKAGLGYVREHQIGDAAGVLRRAGDSFFEDSLEYKADELYWEPGFLQELRRRRGYDARADLPLMFVQTVSDYSVPQHEPVPDFELPGGEGARYRHDYYQTLTDLYLDNHVKPVARWARQFGMRYRAQMGFGNDFDTIRSAREAVAAGALADDESLNAGDTPFLANSAAFDDPSSSYWKFALDHYRQVTSGSQQAGGLEITSELGAWFGHELDTSLRDYRQMMDKEWAAGLTRPLFHGYTHTPAGSPWPGRSHFLGLVGESLNRDGWPEWKHLRELTDYWARGALVLQQGRARTDVAILRDSFITTAAGGAEPPLPLFDSTPLERVGYTIGYVDPQGAATATLGSHGELFPATSHYRAVVLDGTQFYVGPGRIPAATAQALARANERGLAVVVVGKAPRRGLSGRAPRAEDRTVRAAVARILADWHTRQVTRQSQVASALRELAVRPAASWRGARPVYTQRRVAGHRSLYYLWNSSAKPVDLRASLVGSGPPTWLDLWNGTFRPQPIYRRRAGRVEVPVHLAPHATAVVMLGGKDRRHLTSTTADDATWRAGRVQLIDRVGGRQQARLSDGRSITVRLPRVTDPPIQVEDWSLQATTTGPEGDVRRPSIPLAGGLVPWTEIPGLTSESGTGTYEATFSVPSSWVGRTRGTVLDLGAFEGSVQVRVNGHRVDADLDPEAPIDVSRWLRPGSNDLVVELATTPYNKAVASSAVVETTRPLWPASVAHGPLRSYGLLGPVQLVPYARAVLPSFDHH